MSGAFWHTHSVSGPEPVKSPEADSATPALPESDTAVPTAAPPVKLREIGGPAGPDPTRFGDWERGGRCMDF
ncbi:MAG: DUF1674 domain-containing protein [Gammaproteobacteria bacterium]|nr:DUF1674 domain-containing protein [Gammaproteobacteria bacterium]